MKLTTTSIRKLVLPSGVADRIFFDDDVGGFGVRLRAGGSATFIVQYDLGGKSRRVTLGSTTLLDLGAARTKAKDLLAQVRLGGDPAADKHARRAQAAETFGALLPRYLIANQGGWRPQSFKQVERRLQKLARPLHPLPLTAIDRRTISRLISDIAATNGPTAATNAHGTLSGYFSWLLREGLLDQSPMLNTNKPKPRPGRDRVPTEDELRAVWAALTDGDDYGDIVKLIILCCCRRGEIGSLRWEDDVDLDNAVIEIPASRMKNGRSHVVPLSEPALTILQRRPRGGTSYSDAPAEASGAGQRGAERSMQRSLARVRIGCCTISAGWPAPSCTTSSASSRTSSRRYSPMSGIGAALLASTTRANTKSKRRAH